MKTGEGRDFTKGEQKKQPQGESSDLNTETSPSGELLKKLDAPASPERGAGSMGNPRKSYRLGK
jgi:hypothetical protein